MSYNYNQATLVGRLTKDPVFKQISETVCKLTFTLAISRPFRKKDSSPETDFIPVTIFGKNAIMQKTKKDPKNPSCKIINWAISQNSTWPWGHLKQ